jgi:hypothetical protein
MDILTYDREAAVDYARRFALTRNPAYYDFSDLGGDCTNFASQCIYAGAGVMNYTPVFGWYYINAGDRTASWTGVEFFYNFLMDNDGYGPFGALAELDLIQVGDLVQFGQSNGRFYHSAIISEIYPTEILVCAHTFDALDRPLSSYSYDRIRYIHILGVRK